MEEERKEKDNRYRKVKCEKCNREICYRVLKSHLKVCGKREKKVKYCKNEKCNKGENNTRKIIDFSLFNGSQKFCSNECIKIYYNSPVYCSNINCINKENNLPKKLDENPYVKYCCHKCFLTTLNVKGRKGHKKSEKTRKIISNILKKKYKNGQIQHWSATNKNANEIYKNIGVKHSKTVKKQKESGTYIHKKHTDETKQLLREIRIKQVKKYHTPMQVGNNEKTLLDKMEKIDNCKIKRQKYIKKIGWADGYCIKTNTIYEVYEKRHHFDNIEKDKIRQLKIQKYLKCNFVIIYDGWNYNKIERFEYNEN